MPLDSGASLILRDFTRVREEGEEEDEQKAKLDETKANRIQSNVQKMLTAGVPSREIHHYLTQIEGLNVDFEDPKPVKEAPLTPLRAELAVVRGAIRGTVGLGSLLGLGSDIIRHGIGEGAQALGFQEEEPEFEPFMFDLINKGGEGLASIFDPDFSFQKGRRTDVKPGFSERAISKVSEYVTPGGLLTKAMTMKGARLLAKAPEAPGVLQRIMMEAAKNPTKVQFIEAGLNGGSAVAGELAATAAAAGGNPDDIANAEWARFGAEIGFLGFGVLSNRFYRSIVDFSKRRLLFTDELRKKAAMLKVGQWFDEVMQADPKIAKRIAEGQKLETQLGGSFLTSQLAQNPNINAAMAALIATGESPVATRFISFLEAQRARVQNYQKALRPVVNEKAGGLQSRLRTFVDRELSKVDKRIEAAVKKAEREQELLTPKRSARENGEAAYNYLRALEEEDLAKVDALYDQLDNAKLYPINHIKASIAEAAQSRTAREVNRARKKEGLPPVAPLEGRVFGDVPDELIKTAELNFGEGKSRASVLALREWRREVSFFMRQAQRRGDNETVERLARMRDGVDKQFRMMAKRETGKAKSIFDEANRAFHEVRSKYNVGYAAQMLNQSISGRLKLAPEDFGKLWIRTNRQKDTVRAAEEYRRAFGDSPIAKSFLRDAVAWELRQVKDAGGNIERWLVNHKQNLQAHGLWDSFNTVGKAEALAKEAEKVGIVARHDIENSILSSILKTNDLDAFIKRQLKAGRLGETAAAVRATRDKAAIKAFTRKAFDAVLSSADTGTLDTAEQMVKNPDSILITLQHNEKDLIGALGKKHYDSLLRLARIWRIQEGRAVTAGAVPPGIAVSRKLGTPETERIFSKIRASMQGFVSPEFTTVQLLNQAMNLVNHGAAQRIMLEAMFNPDFALELVQFSKSEAGKRAIRFIGTAAVPATVDVMNEEDERTEF